MNNWTITIVGDSPDHDRKEELLYADEMMNNFILELIKSRHVVKSASITYGETYALTHDDFLDMQSREHDRSSRLKSGNW